MNLRTIIRNRIWFRFLCASQGVLFLLFSMGLSLDVHYCQGNIKSIGIYTTAEKCSNEMETLNCIDHSDPAITKTPCCSNKHFSYQSGDAENTSNLVNIQASPSVTIIQSSDCLKTDVLLLEDVMSFNDKDPPLVVKDLNILYDTFLI